MNDLNVSSDEKLGNAFLQIHESFWMKHKARLQSIELGGQLVAGCGFIYSAMAIATFLVGGREAGLRIFAGVCVASLGSAVALVARAQRYKNWLRDSTAVPMAN